MPASGGSIAGLVVYQQTPSGWQGRWSHADLAGVLASESVQGADLNKIPGAWPVQVAQVDGTIIFNGQLQASPLGACIALKWTGVSGGAAASFSGIGLRLGESSLAATFQAD